MLLEGTAEEGRQGWRLAGPGRFGQTESQRACRTWACLGNRAGRGSPGKSARTLLELRTRGARLDLSWGRGAQSPPFYVLANRETTQQGFGNRRNVHDLQILPDKPNHFSTHWRFTTPPKTGLCSAIPSWKPTL